MILMLDAYKQYRHSMRVHNLSTILLFLFLSFLIIFEKLFGKNIFYLQHDCFNNDIIINSCKGKKTGLYSIKLLFLLSWTEEIKQFMTFRISYRLL